jgi:hypothetical protein
MTDNSPVGSAPSDDIRPKRQVNYNQNAVLCPICTKRIRLNNNGRLRVHIVGKFGSDQCDGSDTLPAANMPSFWKNEASLTPGL